MTLTGKQKAALLLTSLDPATAAELLKGIDGHLVQELAVELSYLDAAGHRNPRQTTEIARQFCASLKNESSFQFKSFLNQMLKNTVGDDKAKQIQDGIGDLLQKRDPFMAIRSADSQTLATVLETEHPQAVAVILSELSPKKSSELLEQLGEGVRVSAISRMTAISGVTPEARARIAQMVGKRIESLGHAKKTGAVVQVHPEQSLRKVAIIVRNLEKEVRDGVLEAIVQKDQEAGQKVTDLMIIWDDIPQVGARSLQQGLRGVDERELATALFEADEDIAKKIKDNISERAAAMVDEEASLMSAPKKDEIRQARDKIVNALRELNGKGELTFEEE